VVRLVFGFVRIVIDGRDAHHDERADSTQYVAIAEGHGARENVNQVLARLNRTAEGKDRPEAAVLYDSEVFGLAPVRKFMAGKRDVVVQTVDGRELPARDYIDEWEAKADAEKTRPGSFFAGLSGADTGELRKGWR
jgi:hypothetical protein